uniref:Rho family GTPase 3 n=1 Tax=Gallus gallus TaxID=9031 RepID=A0A8V0XYC4_CHICK
MKERRASQKLSSKAVMDPNQNVKCKIVVVGDSQCGKTALLHVFAKDCFPELRPHRLRELHGQLRDRHAAHRAQPVGHLRSGICVSKAGDTHVMKHPVALQRMAALERSTCNPMHVHIMLSGPSWNKQTIWQSGASGQVANFSAV